MASPEGSSQENMEEFSKPMTPMTPMVAEEHPQDESISLKIGDFVLLRTVLNRGGLLSASGVLDDEIRYNLEPKMFDEGVFQICYPNQYSAARELQEFIEEQQNVRFSARFFLLVLVLLLLPALFHAATASVAMAAKRLPNTLA